MCHHSPQTEKPTKEKEQQTVKKVCLTCWRNSPGQTVVNYSAAATAPGPATLHLLKVTINTKGIVKYKNTGKKNINSIININRKRTELNNVLFHIKSHMKSCTHSRETKKTPLIGNVWETRHCDKHNRNNPFSHMYAKSHSEMSPGLWLFNSYRLLGKKPAAIICASASTWPQTGAFPVLWTFTACLAGQMCVDTLRESRACRNTLLLTAFMWAMHSRSLGLCIHNTWASQGATSDKTGKFTWWTHGQNTYVWY